MSKKLNLALLLLFSHAIAAFHTRTEHQRATNRKTRVLKQSRSLQRFHRKLDLAASLQKLMGPDKVKILEDDLARKEQERSALLAVANNLNSQTSMTLEDIRHVVNELETNVLNYENKAEEGANAIQSEIVRIAKIVSKKFG